jgi:hypothetical protein
MAGAARDVAPRSAAARRRVQQVVDLRFNRRRYDAARTIDWFSARLRDQVELATLTAELLAVVDQTMQPAAASLWLRPSPRRPGPSRRLSVRTCGPRFPLAASVAWT